MLHHISFCRLKLALLCAACKENDKPVGPNLPTRDPNLPTVVLDSVFAGFTNTEICGTIVDKGISEVTIVGIVYDKIPLISATYDLDEINVVKPYVLGVKYSFRLSHLSNHTTNFHRYIAVNKTGMTLSDFGQFKTSHITIESVAYASENALSALATINA